MTREAKYKKLTDLFVCGVTVELPDGDPLWVQALNPWEKSEAVKAGQTARALLSLAMHNEDSSDYVRLRSKFEEWGVEMVVEEIINSKTNMFVVRASLQTRQEEEWRERISVIERSPDLVTGLSEEEQQLVVTAAGDWAQEIKDRVASFITTERRQLELMDKERLWKEFVEAYVNGVGGEQGMAEYRIAEMFYAIRECSAIKDGERWDHDPCGGHTSRFFEQLADVKSQPEGLLKLLIAALDDVQVEEMEAKNSPRQQGSSPSSLLPNGAEESTPSTPDVTSPKPPTTL